MSLLSRLFQNALDGRSERRLRERTQLWLTEVDRKEACHRIVARLYQHQGHLAEQVMTLEEAEELIEDGVESDELLDEIQRRIASEDGILLGYQRLDDDAFLDVLLTSPYRERHQYIIGKTGSGKTNLIRTLIAQDLERGDGIGVLAPEQEMITEEILPFIPDHRVDDVIYFNPADTECPVAFNPFFLDEGEDIDLRADETFTIFQRLMGEGGPRMNEILRHTIYALLERPGTTLLDIPRLLDPEDTAFRKAVSRDSEDAETVHFFEDVYPRLPKDAHLPVVNRVSRLTRSKAIRNILCQTENSLDFRDAMDTGKVLLFNLSDGVLGETNSQLLGQLIISKIQIATMSRANVPKEERRNFWLYLDEFQNFIDVAAASYERMLSRARKYKLGLILAHQTTSQIPTHLLREILGNVATILCFVVSHDDATKLAKEFLVEKDGERGYLAPEDLLSLRTGEAYAKIGRSTVHLYTYRADSTADPERVRALIALSRHNYGSPVHAPRALREAPRNEGSEGEKQKLLDFDPNNPFE